LKFDLRDYQIKNAATGFEILQKLGIVYFSMAVRTGKTLTALECARLYGSKNVLFLTKKKAIASIEEDYEKLTPGYELVVKNNESLHKVEGEFDLVIMDEAHRLSSMPKPCKMARDLKERFSHLPIILLSGTPTPETFSGIYHQFWISQRSPFPEKNFYAWARNYVNVKQRMFPHGMVNDYSDGIKDKILSVISPYMISFSQEEAGFVSTINEKFCHVPMPAICKQISDRLMETGVVAGKTGTISAENAAALLQKVHQVCSGTIILNEEPDGSRRSVIISDAKAQYIAKTWPTEKLVIFYTFKAELTLIKNVLGDRVTTDVKVFQEPGNTQSIALQTISGREGIRLSDGDLIVFFNNFFSATSYYQARDRLTTKERLESNIYWLFSDFDGVPGIEAKIYNVVQGKKKYTTAHFKKDFDKCLNQKFKKGSSANMKQMAILSLK